MRYIYDGMYDRAAKPGPITGNGPEFKRAMRLFLARQRELGKVGRWRKAPAQWKQNEGHYIDSDWWIYEE
jgi:hypothetical protein